MKKLLAGLLLVGSSLSFAQEFRSITIKNLTYPEQEMKIQCLDVSCTKATLDDLRFFNISTLDHTIRDRRGYRNEEKLYSLTGQTIKNIKKNAAEAYYGKAVGNTVLAGGALVVDTVIAAPQMVIQWLTPKRDSVKDKKAAKRIKANLFGDIDEVVLKHKYYSEIKEYLYSYNISEELQGSDVEGPLFRCQLARFGCIEDGGRYGVMIRAIDGSEAINLCEKLAYERNEKFCQAPQVQ